MKKLIKPKQDAEFQIFCDATGEQISWCALFNSYYHNEESKVCPVLGCTIRFNNNYGAIMDSLEPVEIHLSEDVTREFLNWFKEKYPDSEFIKQYFNENT